MKVLFVSHLANFQKFNRPYMDWFRQQGWEVHYASLDDEKLEGADAFFRIPFRRAPLHPGNIGAFFGLIGLYRRERYELVHCHSPIGGLLARLAAVFFPKMKVMYTAHGFHFYKGAPKKNLIVYKTAEKLCAGRTDALITVNKEDYEAAKSFRLRKGGAAYRINGVGTDTARIRDATALPREELGIPRDAFVVLTVAELIKRKNYPAAIRAFAGADIPDSYYVICGNVISDGNGEAQELRELVHSLGLDGRVIFAGYRRDIPRIVKMSDVFLFTSVQEGLPISVIEAMSGGLPVIASDIRGNNELIDGNGFLFGVNDISAYAEALKRLHSDKELYGRMSARSRELSLKYDISNAVAEMAEIYRRYM